MCIAKRTFMTRRIKTGEVLHLYTFSGLYKVVYRGLLIHPFTQTAVFVHSINSNIFSTIIHQRTLRHVEGLGIYALTSWLCKLCTDLWS